MRPTQEQIDAEVEQCREMDAAFKGACGQTTRAVVALADDLKAAREELAITKAVNTELHAANAAFFGAHAVLADENAAMADLLEQWASSPSWREEDDETADATNELLEARARRGGVDAQAKAQTRGG